MEAAAESKMGKTLKPHQRNKFSMQL